MYSDTHFHFNLIEENKRVEVLKTFLERKTFFAQDIGTHCDDLQSRQNLMVDSILKANLNNEDIEKLKRTVCFTAGIWPAVEAIKDRNSQVDILEKEILKALHNEDAFLQKITALGECGLDHHWNPSGVDGRCESDFDSTVFFGECELFEMQLALAKKLKLPVICHSRDAASDTLNCLKNMDYDNGVIHCCTYLIDDVKKFLDRGWYIGFTGSITYTKKSKMEDMKQLLQYIPEDRILLETDAPYLAPVPMRGNPNTPIFIEYVYKMIAEMRSTSVEHLSAIVDKNCSSLFGVEA